jgi:hypothetical protein
MGCHNNSRLRHCSGKDGRVFFTYLVIRTARDYVEHVWAGEEILKLVDRSGRIAVEHILAADRARDPNVTPLTVVELTEWARADGAESIVNAVTQESHHRLRGLGDR